VSGQSRFWSLTESLANTVTGYILAVFLNYYILRWLGIPIDLHQASAIGFLMTLVSIPRGYIIRRTFNWLQVKFQTRE